MQPTGSRCACSGRRSNRVGPRIRVRRPGRLQRRRAPPPDIDGRRLPARDTRSKPCCSATARPSSISSPLGADPNEPEADGTTPLMRAVHGQLPRTSPQLSIAASADVQASELLRRHAAVPRRPRRRCRRARAMLLAAGADANSRCRVRRNGADDGRQGRQRRRRARAAHGRHRRRRRWHELGDSARSRARRRSRGLRRADHPALAANYADVNARERWYGRTALMIAAAEGHADVVRAAHRSGLRLCTSSTRKARPRCRWRAATATWTWRPSSRPPARARTRTSRGDPRRPRRSPSRIIKEISVRNLPWSERTSCSHR